MAYIYFDSSYAPCGFLIVQDNGDPYEEKDSILIQTDWDYPGIASTMGWTPCACGETDGPIDCQHRKTGEMINEAWEFIKTRDGKSFPELNDYFAD